MFAPKSTWRVLDLLAEEGPDHPGDGFRLIEVPRMTGALHRLDACAGKESREPVGEDSQHAGRFRTSSLGPLASTWRASQRSCAGDRASVKAPKGGPGGAHGSLTGRAIRLDDLLRDRLQALPHLVGVEAERRDHDVIHAVRGELAHVQREPIDRERADDEFVPGTASPLQRVPQHAELGRQLGERCSRQPSPSRAARRSATSLSPPTQIGTWDFCTGLGVSAQSLTWKYGPAYEGFSWVQSVFISAR
jgi:hypothetical protein